MSSNQAESPISFQIEVINTYPQTVTCTVFMRSTTGGPVPGPQLTMPNNTIMMGGSGQAVYVQISYPPPTGGSPTTITIPYGAPIDPNRTLNVLWNTSPTTQVVVLVETSVDGGS